MMQIAPQSLEINGWKMRVHNPVEDGPHPLILLLHGWTGDENSMWIFADRLPQDAILLAPRGLFPAAVGGYGWRDKEGHDWPRIDDFIPAIHALLSVLTPENFPSARLGELSLVGFSQGAALAYSLALLHPDRINSVAGLSGFMPEGVERFILRRPLLGKPVFVAHGTRDELVPVERARQSVRLLEQAGASVTYCEHQVGHKLGAACFRSMQIFFSVK